MHKYAKKAKNDIPRAINWDRITILKVPQMLDMMSIDDVSDTNTYLYWFLYEFLMFNCDLVCIAYMLIGDGRGAATDIDTHKG